MNSLKEFSLIGKWTLRHGSRTVVGECKGKKYFIKEYRDQGQIKPSKDDIFSPEEYEKKLKRFNRFYEYRKEINALLRTIYTEGGNIICPVSEFVEGDYYYEVTDYVENTIPAEEVWKLSAEDKKLILQTVAAAMAQIHSKGLIYSDLKPDNIVIQKTSTGYIGKIIDFDSTYLADKKRGAIGGSEEYYSPELGYYSEIEEPDEAKAFKKYLTPKSDIFTLGLVMNYLLSGKLPHARTMPESLQALEKKGIFIHCYKVILGGGELEPDAKVDSPYKEIITEMIRGEIEDRPDAEDVVKWLAKGKVTSREPMPTEFPEPWPKHNIRLKKKVLEEYGYVSGKQDISGDIKGYTLFKSEDSFRFFTVQQLVQFGYAEVKAEKKKEPAEGPEVKITSPWGSHKIEFIESEIKKQYRSVELDIKNGCKGYMFTDRRGVKTFLSVEEVVAKGLAK